MASSYMLIFFQRFVSRLMGGANDPDERYTCHLFHVWCLFQKEGVFEFFKTNFDRHYAASSAPFPMFTHASWMMHRAFDFRKQGIHRWSFFGIPIPRGQNHRKSSL